MVQIGAAHNAGAGFGRSKESLGLKAHPIVRDARIVCAPGK